MVHAKTRKRELVDKLHNLGMSISYDRVLEISINIGNSVCQQFHQEEVVCPSNLRKGLFTTSAYDSIDHKPSATTAKGSFHVTGISLFQHPTENNPGETRKVTHICSDATTKTSISPLTEEYASVRPFVFPREKPEANVTFNDEMKALPVALDTNQSWLKHVSVVVEQSGDDESQATDVSWSVYHASKRSSHPQTDITFPLFREDSKPPAMVRHVIDVIRKAVEFLSPGQVPAIACDQPLYAITKLVQWNFPEFYGEPKLFAMFGGLHIESGAWKTLGDWLAESG